MKRRTLLAAVGPGLALGAGCLDGEATLADDGADGNGTGDDGASIDGTGDDGASSDGSDDGHAGGDGSGDEGAGTKASGVGCPETDVTPPDPADREAVESFVEEFEEAYIEDVEDDTGLDRVSVTLEAVATAHGVARADAHVFFDMSGRDWEATVRPVETATSDEDVEDLERVSSAEEPIADSEETVDALDRVVETGRERSFRSEQVVESLVTATGDEAEFVVDHEGTSLFVENRSAQWLGHGETFVAYRISWNGTFRTELEPEEGQKRDDKTPIELDDERWTELDCW